MSKTIKVIDLLNKIANEEEVPSKVKYNGITYNYCSLNKQGLKYIDLDEERDAFYKYLTGVVNSLNDTVEIIGEEPEIDIQEIEELDEDISASVGEIISCWTFNEKQIIEQQNKILKAVKQLDNQINNK